ncbi:MAG: hypothetical protein GDA66_09405 [Nitrospira sp. CR1.2]|nr:hypothetical protein [Nitrospira sp. CR1.2]
MIRGRASCARILILSLYLALALPLPMVLLDHELGLFTGDPSHTTLDGHAWLDHAAGFGLSETGHTLDAGPLPVSLTCQTHPNPSLGVYRTFELTRGPPLV